MYNNINDSFDKRWDASTCKEISARIVDSIILSKSAKVVNSNETNQIKVRRVLGSSFMGLQRLLGYFSHVQAGRDGVEKTWKCKQSIRDVQHLVLNIGQICRNIVSIHCGYSVVDPDYGF